MKPTETPTTDTALIAIIARKPCGCVSGYDMDPVPEKRAELEAEGYSVTELPLTEARPLLGAAHDTCTHGSTRTQLAAKVKELEAIIAQASGKGVTGTCGVLVDPDGSLPRLIPAMKKTCLIIAASLLGCGVLSIIIEGISVMPHDELEPATVRKVVANPSWGFIGQDQMTLIRFTDGYDTQIGGNRGEPGDKILAYRQRGTISVFGWFSSHPTKPATHP